MAFVSFSSQLVLENSTAVSNAFINEYLPTANGDCVRVYLYGLHMCNSATRYDNTLNHFASNLNLSTEAVLEAFTFWQSQGLVQILSVDPVEIKYLPIKTNSGKIKTYAKEKYADFNAHIQSIIEGRMILPNEFSEYYAFLESFHVEPAAFIMIAKYCANLKGANVAANYILSVARNWATGGIKTVEAVTEKFELERTDATRVGAILKALGLKRTADPNDFELYAKWTRRLGYSDEVISHVAKRIRGSMNKLDTTLLKYFELKLFEKSEITHFETQKKALTTLAIAVNKHIGVFYENVEQIVETYIVPWQQRGFDADMLLATASFCFKSGVRTLEGMDKVIGKFFRAGITTTAALDDFVSQKIADDKQIKNILVRLNITREPNQFDRDCFTTWTQTWNFSEDIINYVITLSANKTSPMQYMNKVLADFFANGIKTLTEAKRASKGGTALSADKQFTRHSYAEGELNRLFSNLDELEF